MAAAIDPSHAMPIERERLSLLQAFPWLVGVSVPTLVAINAISDHVAYAEGDSIVIDGQFDGTTLFALAKGHARLVKATSRAGEFDVDELTSGQTVGLTGLLADETLGSLPLSLMATAPSDFFLIDCGAFRECIDTHDDLAKALLRHAARQWQQAVAPQDGRIDGERRIHRLLIDLVVRRNGNHVIDPMPRHSTMAEQCGVADREVAAVVARLIDSGIVKRDYPGLVVEDLSRLRSLAY
ncbi:hypothetical protein PB2503_05352 [Parvularcula bermudensis HTCC2503]|uniref:Cyclic nucleotide-binding domain-containing protein n=1 Tax=Parvularcula bermudensis (strain ATCC BAA-594 / HTCC2503 / KCTC 12087) TaxID=314260 RepID=E0TGA1_PARBH|nr:Crp/Fnr family transcriptional regulator [Parvularcula bermudensis]ADM09144.1 hypothetical protein PB2503_05352 [Parvularcula bermudensis HTCC2503]